MYQNTEDRQSLILSGFFVGLEIFQSIKQITGFQQSPDCFHVGWCKGTRTSQDLNIDSSHEKKSKAMILQELV